MALRHLVALRRESQPGKVPLAVERLQEHLLEKHGDAVQAVLFYGSCLHDVDVSEGVIDLYVVVDSYSSVRSGGLAALSDWLLPPTLRYLELPAGEHPLRAKYAIFSMRDFLAGTSRRWFHGYLSARLAQPAALVYARDEETEAQLYAALANALATLAARALPMLPAEFSAGQFWEKALALSYASELRSERPGYAETVMQRDLDYYRRALDAAVADAVIPVQRLQQQDLYQGRVSALARQWSRLLWMLRSLQGKLLSLLRLLKGMYTFEGGLDYLAWKLQRHSGQQITIPDKVRRRPMLHIWGLFWDLYRQGVFR